MTDSRVKLLRDDDIPDERCTKIKRHDIDVTPTADVDTKLAEKLDNLLKINSSSRTRFRTNKPRPNLGDDSRATSRTIVGLEQSGLKQRKLTKEELRGRLIKNYDTLVPELDPKRTRVQVVEILSTNQSIELGKDQARKQIQRELELSSVSGNKLAYKVGLNNFKFNDGYELTMKNFATKKTNKNQATTSGSSSVTRNDYSGTATKPKASKSVGFSDNISYKTDIRDDNESDYDDDDSSESDCSSVDD